MNEADKLAMLKVLAGIDDYAQDSILTVYLRLAGQKILSKAFPYDSTQTEVPARYSLLQCEIAAYLWDKKEVNGETSHNENGINRTYESANVPNSMLNEIIPYCGVVG